MIEEVKRAADAAMARVDEAEHRRRSARVWKPSCSASVARSPTFKTGLGALATVDEKRAAGQAVNEATTAVVERLESAST